jgi:hypothetical protein
MPAARCLGQANPAVGESPRVQNCAYFRSFSLRYTLALTKVASLERSLVPRVDGRSPLMEISTNPFAVLTLISAPAVLTNASCVLLFGTGNRYGRAIDRVHELSAMIETANGLMPSELHLRIRQLEASEQRTSLIVRALTCFYTAVAGFVSSTLISLVGAVMVSARVEHGVTLCFVIAMLTGTLGVCSLVVGAMMLVRETRFSFRILKEESKFLTDRARQCLLQNPELLPGP